MQEDKIFDLFTSMLWGNDEDGPFFSKKHFTLSREDQFVEDYILIGIYLIDKLDIKDVVRFEYEFEDKNNKSLKAIQVDGSIIILDFEKYINDETPRQKAYLEDADVQISIGLNQKKVCKKIKKKSPSYLKKYRK